MDDRALGEAAASPSGRKAGRSFEVLLLLLQEPARFTAPTLDLGQQSSEMRHAYSQAPRGIALGSYGLVTAAAVDGRIGLGVHL